MQKKVKEKQEDLECFIKTASPKQCKIVKQIVNKKLNKGRIKK